jgi:ABC-2 type transport system permease protein
MNPLSPPRLVHLLRKEMLETFRDWKMLSMTLTFAPFFVLIMYAYLGHAAPTYRIAVVNQDQGVAAEEGGPTSFGEQLLAVLRAVRSPEGDTILLVRDANPDEVEGLLERRQADLAVFIPPGFTQAILASRGGESVDPVQVRSRGDPANPDYLMAAAWTDMTVMGFVEVAAGLTSPALLAPETVSGFSSLSEFELYVPGLLILALMMLMFTAAGALIREKDKGTLIRLRLSNLRVLEWLSAVTVTQLAVGILALALTFLTAMAVGYRTNGSLGILLFLGVLTSIAVTAFSVLVAAFLRSVFDLVTVGSFPFFVLMFFSGGMVPLPGVPLFHLGDRAVELNEVLPTTHAIAALNRVLSFDAGFGDIRYEIAAMLFLTLVFYALGTWIFTRRHMPAVG